MTTTKGGHCSSRSAFGKVRFSGPLFILFIIGPDGCLQYYTGTYGVIANYGWPPSITATTSTSNSFSNTFSTEMYISKVFCFINLTNLLCTNEIRVCSQSRTWILNVTRKYPLRGYILGVLTHTTALD